MVLYFKEIGIEGFKMAQAHSLDLKKNPNNASGLKA
jgi:hypothetical protein